MDLFKKEEKGKEILNGGKTVKLRLKSNGKYTVEVDDIAVKVTQRGFMNAVNRGFSGTKTFPFSNITAIQFKEPGFTTGYLQFILSGSLETKRGVSGAVRDENSILFTKKELALMSELKEYVEEKQVKVIYFEENASSKVAETLASETGVELAVLNPLESLTQEQMDNGETYLSVMEDNLAALQKSIH